MPDTRYQNKIKSKKENTLNICKMLPQNTSPTGKIFVNPNFKGKPLTPTDVMETLATQRPPQLPVIAHINPLFLKNQPINCRPKIHMNPMFLLKLRQQQELEKMVSDCTCTAIPKPEASVESSKELERSASSTTASVIDTAITRKVICKTKTRLIRAPMQAVTLSKSLVAKKPPSIVQPQIMVVVSKRKLIRKPMNSIQKLSNVNAAKQSLSSVPLLTKSDKTKYKLDNRMYRKKPTPLVFSAKMKMKSYVGRYALRRTSSSQNPILKQNVIKTGGSSSQSVNKKLQLLNINGLLYKSTRNKLQLKDSDKMVEKSIKSQPNDVNKTKPSKGLTIFVRGTKYVMDADKFKLTRVSNSEKNPSSNMSIKSPTRSRIDIGGFTYISAPYAKNVLIRTKNHLSRAYLHNAKQKSVHVLTKHLVKSNIPCPIYQRLGKCAAFERGKCSNLHNKLQVVICSKFLRGECLTSKCLLSHNVSLSKMPVCKFFLQGVCVRNDCPYLHKKLNDNAEVCIEFLRGFCKLADKCNKRHEFVCPEQERNGNCPNKNCIYCKAKQKKESITSKKLQNKTSSEQIKKPLDDHDKQPTLEEPTGKRYFIEKETMDESNKKEIRLTMAEEQNNSSIVSDIVVNDDCCPLPDDQNFVKKRPKLGDLPAFIPLA